MSWLDYVNFLRDNNVCDAAAVLNCADGSLVAGDNFSICAYQLALPSEDGRGTSTVNVNEAALIMEAFKTGTVTAPTGLRLSGIKFQIVRFDEDEQTLYLKKPKGGACAVKTKKTILIGSYNQEEMIKGKNVPQNAGDTNAVVEKLAKILKDATY